MQILIRRSNLLVALSNTEAVKNAWRHEADAVTLELHGASHANKWIDEAIAAASRGAAEVFVRVSRASLGEDLRVAVRQGVHGIMLAGADSAAGVREAAEIVSHLECNRDIEPGSVSFILLLQSARAVWNMRQVITSSPRISQVGLDEVALARDLDIQPLPDYDPFVYARGRLAFESTAAQVNPIGMTYPHSVELREGPYEEIHAAATTARNSGMKGVLCAHASWVAPVNAAFTPTRELVDWNKRVREAFAAGVAAGTAAVPLEGRMIDVPVDEWAIVVLAMAEACAARDAQKRAAQAALAS